MFACVKCGLQSKQWRGDPSSLSPFCPVPVVSLLIVCSVQWRCQRKWHGSSVPTGSPLHSEKQHTPRLSLRGVWSLSVHILAVRGLRRFHRRRIFITSALTCSKIQKHLPAAQGELGVKAFSMEKTHSSPASVSTINRISKFWKRRQKRQTYFGRCMCTHVSLLPPLKLKTGDTPLWCLVPQIHRRNTQKKGTVGILQKPSA